MDEQSFRTLKGFLAGHEPDEESSFCYSATLRKIGDIGDLDSISERLGIEPTRTHRKGDRQGPRSPAYAHDMWSYSPPVDETQELDQHIEQLWQRIKPHKEYLMGLKRDLEVDVFLGYRSNCDHAGFSVSHTSLEMFTELEIPFGVSIIVAQEQTT